MCPFLSNWEWIFNIFCVRRILFSCIKEEVVFNLIFRFSYELWSKSWSFVFPLIDWNKGLQCGVLWNYDYISVPWSKWQEIQMDIWTVIRWHPIFLVISRYIVYGYSGECTHNPILMCSDQRWPFTVYSRKGDLWRIKSKHNKEINHSF